jgi:hypothetical protein
MPPAATDPKIAEVSIHTPLKLTVSTWPAVEMLAALAVVEKAASLEKPLMETVYAPAATPLKA